MSVHQVFRLRTVPVVAALGTAALAAACGGGSAGGSASPQASETGQVTISFVENGPPNFYAPLLSAFNAAHPNIKVVPSSIPFDSEADIVQAKLSQKDSTIDAFIVDQPRTASWAARGYLLDLSSLTAEAKQNLFPAAVQASSYQGKLWDTPLWESSNQMFYNTTLLQKAGVKPPTDQPSDRWTWEQTVAAAKAVQAKTGAKCGLLLEQTDRYYQLQPLAESAGGGPGLTGDGNLTPALNNPGWTKALGFYQELFAQGVTPRSVSADQSDAYFTAGNCAFFVGLPTVAGTLIKNKIPFGIAPEPYFAGEKPVTPNAANAIGVSPFSKHQAAATEFARWASMTVEGNLASVETIKIPPANMKASDPFFAGLAKQSTALTNLGSLVNYELSHTAVARPETIGYVQFETIMQQAFSDIRNGTAVNQALQNATSKLNAAFSSLKG